MDYFIQLNLIEDLDKNSILRTELALALGISERGVYNTIRRYLVNPTPNCNLTKLAAIRFFESKGYDERDIITKHKPAGHPA